MSNVIGQGNLSPYSSQFTSAASKIAKTNVAAVKDQKELKQSKTKDESEDIHKDSVALSKQGVSESKNMKAATMSGKMSEFKKSQSKGRKDDLGELNMFGGDEDIQDPRNLNRSISGTDVSDDAVDDQDLARTDPEIEESTLHSVFNRSKDDILDGVPKHLVPIAEAKVNADLQTNPVKMSEIKPAPDTANIMVEPMPNVDIAPNADVVLGVSPLPPQMDMETSV